MMVRSIRPVTFACFLLVSSLALVGAGCPGSPLVHVSFTGGPQSGHAPLYAQFQGSVSVSAPLVLAKFRDEPGGGADTPQPPQAEPGPEPVRVISWLWNFGDGSTKSGQNVDHTYTDAGCYDVTLTVVLSNGMVGRAARKSVVCVEARNRPPVANAGPDQTVFLALQEAPVRNGYGPEAEVQLDGSESSDPDDDPITYEWAFLEWPDRNQETSKGVPAPELSDSAAEMPTFTAVDPGNYVLQLVVDDGQPADAKVASQPDTVTITVTSLDARNDSFDVTGNVGVSVPAVDGFLSNDVVPGDASVSIDTTSTQGALAANTDGSFSYSPPRGFIGTDTFQYTVDAAGGSDSATVQLNVGDPIWFIDNSASGADAGTLTDPFLSIASFNAVNDGAAMNPGPGDAIFLYEGAGSYADGITLLDNQGLFGEGAIDSSLAALAGITLPPFIDPLPAINGTRPVISGEGTGITLANNNTANGVDIDGAGGGGMSGTGIDGGSFSNIDIPGVGGRGIDLTTCAGTFTFAAVNVTSPGGTAFYVQDLGATGVIDYTGSLSVDGTGTLNEILDINTTAPGSTITFNDTGTDALSSNGGGGIVLQDVDGDLSILPPIDIVNPVNGTMLTGISAFSGSGTISFGPTSVDLPGGGTWLNAAVELNGPSGTVNFNDLSITTNDVGTVGLSVFQVGALNVTGTNTIGTTGGDGIELNQVNSLAMTFDSITVTNSQTGFGGGSGVTLALVTGGTFDVTGTTTVHGATGVAGTGIDVDGSGATFTFADVDIDTTNLAGISVGTVFGNPGTVRINGGTVSNTGHDGFWLENAAGFELNNTTFTGIGDAVGDLTGSTVSGAGNVAVPFSCNDGGGNTGSILFNGGADSCP